MTETLPKKWKRTKWKRLLFYIAGIVVILFIGNSVLNSLVKSTIRKRLDLLSPAVKVSYSSIHTNLFTLSLSLRDLVVRFSPDTSDKQHGHSLKSSNIEFRGINFFKVIFNKKLSIGQLKFEKADIYLDQFLLSKKATIHHDLFAGMPFHNISIDHFEISKSNVWLHTTQENSLLLKGDIIFYEIQINDFNKSFSKNNFYFTSFECSLNEINYSIPGTFHKLHINKLVLNSNAMLQIDSLKINPLDSTIEKAHRQITRIEATVPSIQILNLDFRRLPDRQFIARKILINGNNVRIVKPGKINGPDQSETFPLHFFDQIPWETRIDSFLVSHSSVTYEVNSKNSWQTKSLKAKEILDSSRLATISINHFEIKEAAIRLYSNTESKCTIDKVVVSNLNNFDGSSFRFDAFQCNLSKIAYSIPDEHYTLHIKKFMIDSKKSISRIDSIAIIPGYGKFEFGEKLGHQADRLDATIADIEISKLDVIQLMRKKLIADKISITNMTAHVFRDRRLPRQLKKQPMPNAYLKNIPIEVRLNIFKINNAFVEYEEFPKDGTETGMLQITKMNMSMSPVFNRPHKSDPHYSDTFISGSIMNSGTVEASIHAPMERNIYTIQGFIKDLDLSKLSSSAENLGKFHIESGILNNLDFHFVATEEKASGEIVGEYHNLVIDKLKEKKGKKKIAKIPSFFLRHLIIPKNKDNSMDVSKRTGKIDYKRDPTRLVSFYFLKSLLDGIRASFKLGFLLPK